jgi:hypothetical protein
MSFYSILAAKCAEVSSVLSDFHLLDLLSERGTISILPESAFQSNDAFLDVAPVVEASRQGDASRDCRVDEFVPRSVLAGHSDLYWCISC